MNNDADGNSTGWRPHLSSWHPEHLLRSQSDVQDLPRRRVVVEVAVDVIWRHYDLLLFLGAVGVVKADLVDLVDVQRGPQGVSLDAGDGQLEARKPLEGLSCPPGLPFSCPWLRHVENSSPVTVKFLFLACKC